MFGKSSSMKKVSFEKRLTISPENISMNEDINIMTSRFFYLRTTHNELFNRYLQLLQSIREIAEPS